MLPLWTYTMQNHTWSINHPHRRVKGGKRCSSGNIQSQQSNWILLVLQHRCQNRGYSKTAEALFAKKICKWSCSTGSHQNSTAQAKQKKFNTKKKKREKNLHQLLQVQIVYLSWKTNPHSGILHPKAPSLTGACWDLTWDSWMDNTALWLSGSWCSCLTKYIAAILQYRLNTLEHATYIRCFIFPCLYAPFSVN